MDGVIAVADGVVVVSNAIGLRVMRFSLVFGFELMQSPQQQHKRRFKFRVRRGHEQLLPIFLCFFFLEFNVSVFQFYFLFTVKAYSQFIIQTINTLRLRV